MVDDNLLPARPPQPGADGRFVPQSSDAPERPPVGSDNPPPVLVKHIPPPFSVRMSQLFWVLSLISGAIAVVFFFLIRTDQLPLIIDLIQEVDDTRSEATYERAADFFYWAVFAVMMGILLVQTTLLVSFMSRRKGTRWWQMATVIVESLLFALAYQIVAPGEKGAFLGQLFGLQSSLALIALIISTFPGAIAWTARGHDVLRGPLGTSGAEM